MCTLRGRHIRDPIGLTRSVPIIATGTTGTPASSVIRATPVAAPLVEECYRQALILGAHPHVDLRLPGLDEIYYRTASDNELDWLSPISRFYTERFDAQLSILSDSNTKALTGIDPARMARALALSARPEAMT